MDKSDIRFVLDLSLRQISLNSIFRPVIDDRVESMAMKEAFITLKDHKENFENKPTCRLINPSKPEIWRESKQTNKFWKK